jgi:hypothetical protein
VGESRKGRREGEGMGKEEVERGRRKGDDGRGMGYEGLITGRGKWEGRDCKGKRKVKGKGKGRGKGKGKGEGKGKKEGERSKGKRKEERGIFKLYRCPRLSRDILKFVDQVRASKVASLYDAQFLSQKRQ